MTTQHFTIVKPDDVHLLWHDARPLIEKALKYNYLGSMTSSDALRLLVNEQQQLWIGVDDNELFLASLTEIVPYPQHSVLRIITCATKTGYDLDSWYLKNLNQIEQFGLINGCVALEAWARKGLAAKLNWEHEYSVITKTIKPKQPRKRRRRTKTNG